MKHGKSIAFGFTCILICSVARVASAVPSTFGTSVGNTLLCLNELDAAYFNTYFTNAFGPAYKHEGGAYWFKAGAILWGTPISEVMVSDGTSSMSFLAAVADVTPEKLDEAIIAMMGLHHAKTDLSAYPIRQSNPGSQIVYFKQKSKIFCAKSSYLLPN